LLNHTELITKENSYRIREIEFYYYSVIHTDFYCHKNKRQLTGQKLYFHRFKDPEKYERLKQKGMDITVGNGINLSNFTAFMAKKFPDKSRIGCRLQ
jgi:hypothetical protein